MHVREYDDDNVSASDVRCKAETDKAILCVHAGESYWIPKSQVADDSEVQQKGDEGTLVITKWLAKEEGWYDD